MNIEKLCNEVMDELKDYNEIEKSLRIAFINVIKYLNENPENLSKKNIDIKTIDGINKLAKLYFNGFFYPTIPQTPKNNPDEMVSLIMETIFGYSKDESEKIKITHSQSMACENAVGTLLERYLDSVLRYNGWSWCCGNFVKAIDFIKYNNGTWYELQIKNSSNSENSSSSAIRKNTNIEKWYRKNANNGKTMWDKLPKPMQDLNLSEDGFKEFVKDYLQKNNPNK